MPHRNRYCPYFLLILFSALGACHASEQDILSDAPSNSLHEGEGRFMYVYPYLPGQPIEVWYYLPEAYSPNTPVVMVMHGTNRDADHYRDEWLPHAMRYSFILLVPQFSRTYFPSSRQYHRGNMQDDAGRFLPERLWTFTVVDSLFLHVKHRLSLTTPTFALYGHSAGGQFVHRYALFRSSTYAHLLIAANAGWYTMPTWETDYPYGLRNSPLDTPEELAHAFKRHLIILLGEEDTDPNDPYLNTSPEAMAQGPHRFARGIKFMDTARKTADSLNLPLCWVVQTVPHVGHSNRGMSEPAAQLIFFPPEFPCP